MGGFAGQQFPVRRTGIDLGLSGRRPIEQCHELVRRGSPLRGEYSTGLAQTVGATVRQLITKPVAEAGDRERPAEAGNEECQIAGGLRAMMSARIGSTGFCETVRRR
jgi:hypothetical protein